MRFERGRAVEVRSASGQEIVQGDLEAGAEFRRLEDRLEALLCRFGEGSVAVVEQIREGAVRATSDASAELMELCEAEALSRLCENVTGTANKRSAARWLSAWTTTRSP